MAASKPIVVSINSVSGGGKTILAQAVHQKLENSALFCFDEYDDSNVYPADFCDWYRNGANVEEFAFPKMADAVFNLLQKAEAEIIILDFPFGRSHSGFRNIIDLTVYIDTPLDIALARRICRDKPAIQELILDLKEYESRSREVYLGSYDYKDSSDLVLDGLMPVEELAEQVIRNIKNGTFVCRTCPK